MRYIIDTANKQKVAALKEALLNPNFDTDPTVIELTVKGIPDVRPRTYKETEHAAREGVNAVVRTFLENPDRTGEAAVAICIQNGITVDDDDIVASFISIVAIRKTDSDIIHTEYHMGMFISHEVRKLTKGGMDLYDALGVIYGDDVRTKKVPLYEKLGSDMSFVKFMATGIEILLVKSDIWKL